MFRTSGADLERVVRSLCEDVRAELHSTAGLTLTESYLRRELFGCVLGSQIRHASAVAWTDAIQDAGLLDDEWFKPRTSRRFEAKVLALLSGRTHLGVGIGRYRFFRTRSAQLARCRDALSDAPLTLRLAREQSVCRLRRELVDQFPGLGPKQASLLLRNAGWSFDVAVLDSHVLRFMQVALGVFTTRQAVSSMSGYEHVELRFRQYADSIGYSSACVDWAIWATMRAATELAA